MQQQNPVDVVHSFYYAKAVPHGIFASSMGHRAMPRLLANGGMSSFRYSPEVSIVVMTGSGRDGVEAVWHATRPAYNRHATYSNAAQEKLAKLRDMLSQGFARKGMHVPPGTLINSATKEPYEPRVQLQMVAAVNRSDDRESIRVCTAPHLDETHEGQTRVHMRALSAKAFRCGDVVGEYTRQMRVMTSAETAKVDDMFYTVSLDSVVDIGDGMFVNASPIYNMAAMVNDVIGPPSQKKAGAQQRTANVEFATAWLWTHDGLDVHTFLLAVRDIAPGEELLLSYGTNYWKNWYANRKTRKPMTDAARQEALSLWEEWLRTTALASAGKLRTWCAASMEAALLKIKTSGCNLLASFDQTGARIVKNVTTTTVAIGPNVHVFSGSDMMLYAIPNEGEEGDGHIFVDVDVVSRPAAGMTTQEHLNIFLVVSNNGSLPMFSVLLSDPKDDDRVYPIDAYMRVASVNRVPNMYIGCDIDDNAKAAVYATAIVNKLLTAV
jgi:hypothetical protein